MKKDAPCALCRSSVDKLRLISVAVFLLVFNISPFAQTTGYVFGSSMKTPVAYANIWVEDSNIGTTSDLKGAFSFPENLIGKTLLVSAIGYYSESLVIGDRKSVV